MEGGKETCMSRVKGCWEACVPVLFRKVLVAPLLSVSSRGNDEVKVYEVGRVTCVLCKVCVGRMFV